jgi:pyrroline-5-carboxylate reductase
MTSKPRLAILGTGNIGRAMAVGFAGAGRFAPADITLTRRRLDRIQDLADRGFDVQGDNHDAVRRAGTVILAVEPQQLNPLLEEIGPDLEPRHTVVTVVSGASVAEVRSRLPEGITVVRAMPNIAVALGCSMTCLAADPDADRGLQECLSLFGAVGTTLVVREEQMIPATALSGCGIAFFLRAIRAASQGGIEIGFHPDEALAIASQTALGAASLALADGRHPESEIDKVTTPRGCTISGLNQMEHRGFGSALIRGIVASADKARSLYSGEEN